MPMHVVEHQHDDDGEYVWEAAAPWEGEHMSALASYHPESGTMHDYRRRGIPVVLRVDSVEEAREHLGLVSLADLADELGIRQTAKPFQPVPPVDVLREFDQTMSPWVTHVSGSDADQIRQAWHVA